MPLPKGRREGRPFHARALGVIRAHRQIADGRMHPGPRNASSLRGAVAERGSRSVSSRTWGASRPHAGPTDDDGCTGAAEEGNVCPHPRGTRPSLGLPAHEPRATGSRHRKVPSRWMREHYRSRQALTGKSGAGGAVAGVVVRGTSASTLARAESPRSTKREGDCGPRRDAKIEVRWVCSYVALFQVAEVDRRPLQAP